MSGIRDHAIFVFPIEFCFTHYKRDFNDDLTGIEEKICKTKTVRIIANKYHPIIAEAIVRSQYENVAIPDTLKIGEPEIWDIDGFVEEHIW